MNQTKSLLILNLLWMFCSAHYLVVKGSSCESSPCSMTAENITIINQESQLALPTLNFMSRSKDLLPSICQSSSLQYSLWASSLWNLSSATEIISFPKSWRGPLIGKPFLCQFLKRQCILTLENHLTYKLFAQCLSLDIPDWMTWTMMKELNDKLIHDSIKLKCFHMPWDSESCSLEKVHIDKDIRSVLTFLSL